MAYVVIRLLFAFVLVVNLILVTMCILTGQNLYKLYGGQIIRVLATFICLVICLYMTFALIGLTN